MKATIFVIALYIAIVLAWLTAIVHDASSAIYGWLVVDIFVCPLGVLRGVGIWLGML